MHQCEQKTKENCGIFVVQSYKQFFIWFYFKNSFIKIMNNKIYFIKNRLQIFKNEYDNLYVSNLKKWKSYN